MRRALPSDCGKWWSNLAVLSHLPEYFRIIREPYSGQMEVQRNFFGTEAYRQTSSIWHFAVCGRGNLVRTQSHYVHECKVSNQGIGTKGFSIGFIAIQNIWCRSTLKVTPWKTFIGNIPFVWYVITWSLAWCSCLGHHHGIMTSSGSAVGKKMNDANESDDMKCIKGINYLKWYSKSWSDFYWLLNYAISNTGGDLLF